jgi:mono/diheme cytochrome c family protein
MAGLLKRVGAKRLIGIPAIVLLIVIVGLGGYVFALMRTDVAEAYGDEAEHFKYGSVGTETGGGIPYWIWRVLPDLFPEYLPDREGEGYGRLGFIFESADHNRPVGMTYRRKPIPLVALNCAPCHAGTLRESAEAPRQIILGMPAQQFDPQGYVKFLTAAARDERFNADTLIQAIQEVNPEFSWVERLLYRNLIIPQVKEGLIARGESSYWFDMFPPQGPGRVDIFTQAKIDFGIGGHPGEPSGATEFTSVWNQRAHEGLPGRWDGNSTVTQELARAAALGSGATSDSLDTDALGRVETFMLDLPVPKFPTDRIDTSKVAAGEAVFQANCAACHAFNGARLGEILPIGEIGTDPDRLDNVTAELIEAFNEEGKEQPWGETHFRKTDGYVNMPLDGVWLRAPYLHNGSVPTLRDLLRPPAERPAVFYRGYDVYDFDNLGFVSAGADAEAWGVRLDTSEKGNGNQGHIFGTTLSPEDKEDLLEFLKTQ